MNDFLEQIIFEDVQEMTDYDLEEIPFEIYKTQETDILEYKFDELVGYRKQFLAHLINHKKMIYKNMMEK